MPTNEEPVIDGSNDATWRRVRQVPFNVSFIGREDNTIDKKLERELPGLLNSMLEGCLQWQEHGLQELESVIQSTEEWRANSDPVAEFVEEACVRKDAIRIVTTTL